MPNPLFAFEANTPNLYLSLDVRAPFWRACPGKDNFPKQAVHSSTSVAGTAIAQHAAGSRVSNITTDGECFFQTSE